MIERKTLRALQIAWVAMIAGLLSSLSMYFESYLWSEYFLPLRIITTGTTFAGFLFLVMASRSLNRKEPNQHYQIIRKAALWGVLAGLLDILSLFALGYVWFLFIVLHWGLISIATVYFGVRLDKLGQQGKIPNDCNRNGFKSIAALLSWRHTLVIIATAAIIVVAILVRLRPSGGAELTNDFKIQCQKVTAGMSRQEVRQLLGEPRFVSYYQCDSIVEEYWCYDCRTILAAPFACRFDSSAGIVLEIKCGD